MELSDFNITVVGLGLIGGSYALGLKEMKPKNLWGVDLSEETLEKAKNRGMIDEGYTDPSVPLSKSDLVIMAIYPEATEKFLVDNMKNFKSGAVITDGVGIKTHLLETVGKCIREDVDFVGGHPMAGKEEGGIDKAELKMFSGANYIITPVERNKEENIVLIENLAKSLGFGSVIRTTPEIHDENIAYVSQLPHIVAVSMVNCKDVEGVDYYAGSSYRDTTRIAKINGKLWSELFIKNKDKLIDQIDLFIDYAKELRDSISEEDYDKLNEMLDKSFKRKEELNI